MDIQSFAQKVTNALKSGLPKDWDGKNSIIEMRDNGGHNWKQMEWPGFYFQWKCEGILVNQIQGFSVPGPKYGNVEFDGFYDIPWDFKAHSIESGNNVPTNGLDELKQAIKQYGHVGFIIAEGSVTYDEPPFPFKQLVDELKGKKSAYEIKREARGAGSRRRKTSFTLQNLTFIVIDKKYLENCKPFQEGMINSNGNKRKKKMMLNLQDEVFLKVVVPY